MQIVSHHHIRNAQFHPQFFDQQIDLVLGEINRLLEFDERNPANIAGATKMTFIEQGWRLPTELPAECRGAELNDMLVDAMDTKSIYDRISARQLGARSTGSCKGGTTMKTRASLVAAAVIGVVAVGGIGTAQAAPSGDDEIKVSLNVVPRAVLATIIKEAKGGNTQSTRYAHGASFPFILL